MSMMFKKNRWMISLAVLGTMGFTLFCVFAVRCRPHLPLHLRVYVCLSALCGLWLTSHLSSA